MSKEIHLLWFVQERNEGEDTGLLIGVYETEEDAKAPKLQLTASEISLGSSIFQKDSKSIDSNWSTTVEQKALFKLTKR